MCFLFDRVDGVGWGGRAILSPEVRSETNKLLPLFIIDIIRVVFDLQEGNGRLAVVQIRFIKIRVKPHVEAVPVLVQCLPVVKTTDALPTRFHRWLALVAASTPRARGGQETLVPRLRSTFPGGRGGAAGLARWPVRRRRRRLPRAHLRVHQGLGRTLGG